MKGGEVERSLYTPMMGKPMRVVLFASGGGGNLGAAIRLSDARPDLVSVALVITDRPNIPAIDLARSRRIPIFVYNFEAECGIWGKCKDNPDDSARYRAAAEAFHDSVLADIQAHENNTGVRIDLAVLSYHRWIHGSLLRYFQDRMINQHAGDLTVMSDAHPTERRYIGINPVLAALRAGERRTRTSTFLVQDNCDGGEILCQGPWVVFDHSRVVTKETALQHEILQKRRSDWPALTYALTEIAQGNYTISNKRHTDGCRVLYYRGQALPYDGVDLQSEI